MVGQIRPTKGVQTLLGDPKKAILKLSAPMMLGMLMQALYNVADGFWVAGLGTNELAAIGLFFPFFIILISLGTGIGIGGGSAISRRIGKKNKKEADNSAVQTIIIGFIITALITFPIYPFLENIFIAIGESKEVGALASDYAKIIFCGSILIIFFQIFNAILRGEGDANRSMYAIVIGALLNIALDPLFIYYFDMGVIGAAWATVISYFVSTVIITYWLFVKKNTFIELNFKKYKFDKKINLEILEVGIPSALAQISMSLTMLALNIIIAKVGGTDGIAIFTSGWRIVMLGTIPLVGMATGVTAVTGAAFGAQNKNKLKTAFFYAIKIGFILELFVGLSIFIFANQIAYLFTYSEGSEKIYDDLVTFLKITAFLYPTIPFGMLTSSMFRGVGKGRRSLTVTIFRTIILQIPVAYLFAIVLNLGLEGAWYGILTGNFFAVIFTFLWGKHTVETIIPNE
ncbi:MAG: MATE family efflux transporter [Bacteroidota bacterium]|nr:MATE family efflux transporter [Bacteroidota bacterium]